MSYSSCLITFGLFMKFNGSIVVGDKSAHEATFHIPQLFYFSLFCLVFSWPVFLFELYGFLRCAISHKKKVVSIAILMAIIVFSNTLVHPYLLADNRHYTFYVWNRLYGPKIYFRYFMIPIYMWALYVMVKYLYNKHDISFLIMYIPCLAAVLVTQKLVDVRYFLIPYIIFKLKMEYTSNISLFLIAELITNLMMNIFVFYRFFYRPIPWADYEELQRLIW
nr:putative Dol-P-Glc:Glc(2)Man(9)GlcNAc(2)-PP-Dol alpha-1,2-glucosyltransferase [Leptinotarsa decemlineata]